VAFLDTNPVATRTDDLFVTRADFRKLFTEHTRSLYLLSFLLTADHQKAERCFVRGLDDCLEERSVFQEWVESWTRRIIVHNAIRMMAPHLVPATWAQGTINSARKGNRSTIRPQDTQFAGVLALGDFERFVYVLSVLERYTDQNCAVLLGVSQQEIRETRRRALQHAASFDKRNTVPTDSHSDMK